MFLRSPPTMKPKFEEGIRRIRSSIANLWHKTWYVPCTV